MEDFAISCLEIDILGDSVEGKVSHEYQDQILLKIFQIHCHEVLVKV